MDDAPIPRDEKLQGWKLPSGVVKSGRPEAPDACPFCGEINEPIPGAMLGQVMTGDGNGNPEPWEVIADCSRCGAHLRRIPGDPWVATAP